MGLFTRRGALGAGVAAGPSVAQSALNTVNGLGMGVVGMPGAQAAEQLKIEKAMPNRFTSIKQALRYVPGARERLRELVAAEHGPVQHIDPDIMNKKSWSDMVKVQTQKQRNIDRTVEIILNDYGSSKITIHGFIHTLLRNGNVL
jgi:hypothetical protein